MPRTQHKPPYDPMPHIHDHFNGSANCRDCGGICTLVGADRALTDLVRAIFEANAYYGQKWSYMAECSMKEMGVPAELFLVRARKTVPAHIRRKEQTP